MAIQHTCSHRCTVAALYRYIPLLSILMRMHRFNNTTKELMRTTQCVVTWARGEPIMDLQGQHISQHVFIWIVNALSPQI